MQDTSRLDNTLAELEGTSGGFGQPANLATLIGLNRSFEAVYDSVDSADAAPTSQALAAFADLQKALPLALAKWNEMKTRDLPAFNEKLRAAGFPEIQISGEGK
jgi:hypothetical protein